MFAQKCVRLPILVIPFVISLVNFDIYNKSMIVQFIFVHTIRRILTDACTNKSTYEPSPRWIYIFNSSPRWIFLLFYSKLDKLSQFVHKSNIAHGLNNIYKTRLQSATKRRAASTELGIDVCCFWPES